MAPGEFAYFHFSIVPVERVQRALADKWSPEQLEAGHDYWQATFHQRTFVVYRAQYDQHHNFLMNRFRRSPEFNPETGLEGGWCDYAERHGLFAHRDRMDAYSEPNCSFGAATLADPIDMFTTEYTPPDVAQAIWTLWFEFVTRAKPEEEARLRRLPYQAYLQTRYWRRVRAALFIAHNLRCKSPRCVDCDSWYGGERDLHVHHLHYRNKGREQLDNLILLCAACHQLLHSGHLVIRPDDVEAATF